MKPYSIKSCKKDYIVLKEEIISLKGTRKKLFVKDVDDNYAMFKYQLPEYNTSEACSEKMCYEICKVLDYNCARIELAVDENGNLGILNYIFKECIDKVKEHHDAISYLKKVFTERKDFYTISNIKRVLDSMDTKLFSEFIKLMIFDALVGEQDRHEENWGLLIGKNGYSFSPFYDNGCSLLKEFYNKDIFLKYYNGEKDFDSYIKRSKTFIYKDNNQERFKHFELIRYLNDNYHNIVQKELKKLEKLNDKKICEIVNKIPNDLLTKEHKEFIIRYLKARKEILINIK